MVFPRHISAVMLLLTAGSAALAAETDQFMVWDRTLEDAAPVLNAFFNDEVERCLEKVNARTRPPRNGDEATQEVFKHLFQGLHASRVRNWLNTSRAVDRCPDHPTSIWRYQRDSIYRDLSFPFVLPMGRNVRVGDVYFGADKIGHMLGFGRRYFQRYRKLRDRGVPEEEAIRRVVLWGLASEVSLVGGITDGIISHADLEANYQGFRLAMDCARGPAPYLVREDRNWVLARPIDLRDYITPDLDETYNASHFMGTRWGQVAAIIRARHGDPLDQPLVRARFERYAARGHSLARQIIEAHYAGKHKSQRIVKSLDGICMEEAAE